MVFLHLERHDLLLLVSDMDVVLTVCVAVLSLYIFHLLLLTYLSSDYMYVYACVFMLETGD